MKKTKEKKAKKGAETKGRRPLEKSLEKKTEENKKVEKKEILAKPPEKKVEEKKEDVSKKTLSDWKNLLVDGFSLEKFQKEPKKENFSLESNLEKTSKNPFPQEQGYEINRKYEERDSPRNYSRNYSQGIGNLSLARIQRDFSSLGKVNSSLQEFRPTFNFPSGDFFENEEQPDYVPLRTERFSRETKSFSQIERENFEGIKTNREYKEVRF
jgi:hypothetical protein